MKKECITKLALFIGGTLFGSIGLKILSSKDAKNAYAHVTAAALRMKESALDTADKVQASAEDILAQAKDINDTRKEVIFDKEMEEESFIVE